MELRDLRAFVTLGDLLHFGQAAARLHITQSALSKQIQRLESSLGGSLFERSARYTRLTTLGRAVHEDARQVIQNSDRLAHKAQAVLRGLAGTLRIGFGVGTREFVPAAISRFRQIRSDVNIELFDLSSHHQVQALAADKLDIGFCRLPAPGGWPALSVVRACFVAVIPASYDPAMSLSDLAQQRMVTTDHDKAPAFHSHLMNYLASQGLRIRETQSVNDFASAVALAAAGVAWAIVPSSTMVDVPGVRVLNLDDPAATWEIGLMRPAGPADPLVQAFWDVVAGMVAEGPVR